MTDALYVCAALATEDPSPDLLLETPHGRTEPLINLAMWTHIIVQGLYQVCALPSHVPSATLGVSRGVLKVLLHVHWGAHSGQAKLTDVVMFAIVCLQCSFRALLQIPVHRSQTRVSVFLQILLQTM